MLRIYKILTLTISLFLSFDYVFAQQYCIYQRDFNQWLCNNVRGAQQACYAPDYVGNFPDYNSCENARKSALPYDVRWQRMSRCVPCGSSREPSSQQPQPEPRNSEQEKLVEEVRREAQKQQDAREQYVKSLLQEKEQKNREFKEEVFKLSSQMKTSPPPMNSFQKEQYKKALEQAYCAAYTSIKAAEIALQGKFEISKNLITDLENIKATAGAGFDTEYSGKLLSSCPKDINFKIPDVRMSIEKDPQYVKYIEIAKNVQALIPKIEANFNELQTIQEKKEQAKKKIKEVEAKIEKVKKDKDKAKTQKDKETDNDLLAKALALKQQAEVEYQEALQNEQRLLKEKQEIENKLAEMKNKMLAEEKR